MKKPKPSISIGNPNSKIIIKGSKTGKSGEGNVGGWSSSTGNKSGVGRSNNSSGSSQSNSFSKSSGSSK